MSHQVLLCPRCGIQNLPDARFCEKCGTLLSAPVAQTVQAVGSHEVRAPVRSPEQSQQLTSSTPHVEGTSGLPLYSIPVKLSDENIRAEGEMAKASLFGLAGKRTFVGKRPEEYIVLESISWANQIYVRMHGVYTSTYVVSSVFPLTVGEDTIEVEVAGPTKLTADKGTLILHARLRKTNRQEATSYYDERGEEVQIQLPAKPELKPQRTVHAPLTVEHVQELLDTTMEWAKRHLMASMSRLVAEGATIEQEKLDLSDHEIILVPNCTLVYHNTKTGERKSLTYDSLAGRLLPSSIVSKR